MTDLGEMPTTEEVRELSIEVGNLLRGKDATLVGATLIEVVSLFFAGHHPEIREGVIEFWIENMRSMVQVNADLYHEAGDWDIDGTVN
jgi:hypothetical protein